MWYELRMIFRHLDPRPDVRAIILSGAGDRAFTAGLDIVNAASSSALGPASTNEDPARRANHARRHILDYQSCVSSVEEGAKPVVCVLHGICFGLAIDLSSSADVRFATADARLAVKEVDIGLAADVGTLTRLPKIVGSHSWVKDVALTARVFGADEALRVGFVSAVAPDKKAALNMALQWAMAVAEKSPVAAQGTKEFLNYSRDHSTHEGLRHTAVWNSAALQTNDIPAAIQATREKSRPRFEKL
jgi:delta(3,5)-delta(2,4)-dienoyl-CoA isomerase